MKEVEQESLSTAKKVSAGRAGRPRSFDRDDAVLTALRLFQRHGYEGVSIADLTGALGIAPPSLYAAFGSKAALFEEALDLYVRESDARSAARLQAADTIEQWVRILLEAGIESATESGMACLVSGGMIHCGPNHHDVAAIVGRRRSELFETISLGLTRWRSADEAERLARFLCALLQGISIQAGDGVSREQLGPIVEYAVSTL